MKPTETAIRVEHLSKSFDGEAVLSDVSFQINFGEALAVIGPSGSGKTTLLKCINMLAPLDGGRIWFDGKLICEAGKADGRNRFVIDPNIVRRQIGMVFQEWNLWPNKTVAENIAEGPIVVLREKKRDAIKAARTLAGEVGLRDRVEAFPNHLSGGQKQRVAIARALAMRPRVLMLDEVTSALDAVLVSGILDLISALKTQDRALLVVTHHLQFARSFADRILFLNNGKVGEIGTPEEILERPKTKALTDFLLALNRLR
jgi:polar amino acid transport system ATP-binding protein